MSDTPEAVRAYLAGIGKKGGSSRSKRKSAAARKLITKLNLKRWREQRAIEKKLRRKKSTI